MLSKIDEIPSEADLLPFGFQDDIGIERQGIFHCPHLSHIPDEDAEQPKNVWTQNLNNRS